MRPWLAVICLLFVAGCGNDEPRPEPAIPDSPGAFLAWVRNAAEANDPDALEERLAAWPVDDEAFVDAEETQIALTWQLRLALEDDPRKAIATFDLLTERFAEAVTPEGIHLSPEMLRAGLVDAVIGHVAASVEAGEPDLDLLDVVAPYMELPRERDRAALVRRWASLSDVNGLELELAAHDGPRVVVLTDHFALGEAVLPSVLRRWQRDLGPMGLRVSLVPTPKGSVRVGIRRVRAHIEEEVDAIRQRGEELGLAVERPFQRDETTLAAALKAFRANVAVFVADRKGRIVSRRTAAVALDPSDLEEAVQRVATR